MESKHVQPSLRTFFTLAEERALPELGPDCELLPHEFAAEAERARERCSDLEHLRMRLAVLCAAVHSPDEDVTAQEACRSVEPGDRVLLRVGHIVAADRSLRHMKRVLVDAVQKRLEPRRDGLIELMDRWDSEGESVVFQRERAALVEASNVAPGLPRVSDPCLADAHMERVLERLAADPSQDPPERTALLGTLAEETGVLATEALLARLTWHPDAFDALVHWGVHERLLGVAPAVFVASFAQVSAHLSSYLRDLSALAREADRPELAAKPFNSLLEWARAQRLIDEPTEIVLRHASYRFG